MIKKSILKAVSFSLMGFFAFSVNAYSAKVTITTSPITAEIWDNGQLMGSGTYTFSTPKKGNYDHLIEIKAAGRESITQPNSSHSSDFLFPVPASSALMV